MNFTMYTMLGIVGGLGLSLLAFQKWNLPGYCRKRFKLNTRVKMLIFTLVTGFVLALLLSMVMDMIGISGVAHEQNASERP
ncbi:hypothetical protein LJC07_06985 [Christensenellaceae bacterium OttesenSCG-928-L17]|nr:hypothetical protein [Christensenellaceae bacterium OttesenSCG-928-L17]